MGIIARLSSRRESEARRTRTLAAATRELTKVVRLLKRFAEDGGPPRAGARTGQITAADIEAILAARRLRDLCLGPEVGDVAWSLLLEAFAARLEGRLVPLTSLGAGEGIPRSTAHRWTRALIDRGLLTSHADPGDDRITLVGLTDEAAGKMRTYLANAASLTRWAA